MSFSFVAFIVSMNNTTVANVVLLSTLRLCSWLFLDFLFKKKVSLIGSSSIFLAMSGILIMVGTQYQQDLYLVI